MVLLVFREQIDRGVIMGIIHQNAQQAFFDSHPDNADLVRIFLTGFDISFACEKHMSNTTVYAYILKPEDFMKDAFGFDKEMLLVYSPYDRIEPRAIHAIDELYRQYPFIGRVDMLTCFFLSDDSDVENWIRTSAISENIRVIIPFSKQEAVSNRTDAWYIRNKLRRYFFGRDLFSVTLPINSDTGFFGRQQIVARYIDSIKRSENRGIFGLRKTGKTSLLFKIERVITEQQLGVVLSYNCRATKIRRLHSAQLLYVIYQDICGKIGISPEPEGDEITNIRHLEAAVEVAADKNIKLVLFFDEIEYISFLAPLDEHWKNEYVDFWQTMWTIQDTFRNLVFIVAGVNASVTEKDPITVNGNNIQNPLFVIVQSEYLRGFSFDECSNMVRTLGRRMGLKFKHEAIKLLYQQYGGHPMLTRQACSKLHLHYSDDNRPIEINEDTLSKRIPGINADIVYYFRHVISDLQDLYSDEYEMFELLASGQIADYLELAKDETLTSHLVHYGLIEVDNSGLPKVKLPVAADYVALELAKRENRKTIYRLIPKEERKNWVERRIRTIIRDMRELEMAIKTDGSKPSIFGPHSFPEADRLLDIPEVDSNNSFVAFVNIINRCFVESIESYGKEIGQNNYFWNDIKNSYPTLWAVLHRAKVYRHSQDHLHLNPQVERAYNDFRAEDTAGFTSIQEQLFAIQQKLLDGFLASIQAELSCLT